MATNRNLVPQAQMALAQLKYEIAQELGIDLPEDGYYGKMSTKEIGTLGGNMTRRLVQMGLHTVDRK